MLKLYYSLLYLIFLINKKYYSNMVLSMSFLDLKKINHKLKNTVSSKDVKMVVFPMNIFFFDFKATNV